MAAPKPPAAPEVDPGARPQPTAGKGGLAGDVLIGEDGEIVVMYHPGSFTGRGVAEEVDATEVADAKARRGGGVSGGSRIVRDVQIGSDGEIELMFHPGS